MKLKTAEGETRATLKIPEAAKIAGVGTRSIYIAVAAGTIPFLRFGRNILIPRSAFMRWLDSCGGRPQAGAGGEGAGGGATR
jgi:excisionase family DNA binding protein